VLLLADEEKRGAGTSQAETMAHRGHKKNYSKSTSKRSKEHKKKEKKGKSKCCQPLGRRFLALNAIGTSPIWRKTDHLYERNFQRAKNLFCPLLFSVSHSLLLLLVGNNRRCISLPPKQNQDPPRRPTKYKRTAAPNKPRHVTSRSSCAAAIFQQTPKQYRRTNGTAQYYCCL